jgi:hypothetical protein
MTASRLSWVDPAGLARALDDPDARAGLLALAHECLHRDWDGRHAPPSLDLDRVHTLGQWGPAQPGH